MDQGQSRETSTNERATAAGASSEPVRSRWAPRAEQIQILESIFNSGTVNPAKGETIKIREILEQYGTVGDANVFYWFQNRRSRSRRRQRQLQAAAAAAGAYGVGVGVGAGASPVSSSSNSSVGRLFSFCPTTSVSSAPLPLPPPGFNIADDRYGDDLFSISRPYTHMFSSSSDGSQLQSPSGTMTVFINGTPSEVPRVPFDLRAMFGQDVMLVHSSGELLHVNEHGHLLQALQMGESYFLVSSAT